MIQDLYKTEHAQGFNKFVPYMLMAKFIKKMTYLKSRDPLTLIQLMAGGSSTKRQNTFNDVSELATGDSKAKFSSLPS